MDSTSEGRAPDQLRALRITPDFTKHAEGSVLIEAGETRVICTASVEDKVPPFIKGTEKGWVTSEYGMLPRSTTTRSTREASRGRPSGRTQEIQRLIGRSLRSVFDLSRLGERTIWLDCDVIQADGGTRTASITGAFVAVALAVSRLLEQGVITQSPLMDFVAAVSVGVVDETERLDLCYEQDVQAEVDMNVVMTGSGEYVEIQGTAEGSPFSADQLAVLLDLAARGIHRLVEYQADVLQARLGNLQPLFPAEVLRRLEDSRRNPKSR